MGRTNALGADFTTGSVMKALLAFLTPFLLASLLNSLYNTVDMVIIGQFVGSTGTVAVSLGGKMLNLFTQVGIGLAGGGQVLISQLVGAQKRDQLQETIGTLFTEMLLLSVVLGVGTVVCSEGILRLLNTPPESYAQALSYLRITSWGLPLIFGYNAVSSVLRGMGDSRHPLLFIAIAALLNLALDILFIVRFRMGATGTALATVIGQGVSLVFSLVLLYRRRAQFGFDFRLRSFVPVAEKLKIMLKIGLPMAARSCLINITQLYMMSFVNTFGLAPAAAYGIGDKIVHLANVVDVSVRQASGTMIGQNVGAGKPDRVRQVVRASLALTLSSAAVLVLVGLLFPQAIFGIFTTDGQVLALSRPFMYVCMLIFVFSALLGSLESVVVGTGFAMLGFLGGLLDGIVLRICFSFLFGFQLGMGAVGFFLGDALARLGPITLDSIYYLSGAWRRRKKLME